MRALVLGCGLQGRSVAYDLARSPAVDRVCCADLDEQRVRNELDRLDCPNVEARSVDANNAAALEPLMGGYNILENFIHCAKH